MMHKLAIPVITSMTYMVIELCGMTEQIHGLYVVCDGLRQHGLSQPAAHVLGGYSLGRTERFIGCQNVPLRHVQHTEAGPRIYIL